MSRHYSKRPYAEFQYSVFCYTELPYAECAFIVKALNCQRNDGNNINRTTGIIDLGFKNDIY